MGWTGLGPGRHARRELARDGDHGPRYGATAVTDVLAAERAWARGDALRPARGTARPVVDHDVGRDAPAEEAQLATDEVWAAG
jgi:hypothetical protein